MEKNINKVKIILILSIIIIGLLFIVLSFEFIKIGQLKNKEKQLNNTLSSLSEDINNYTAKNDYYGNGREVYLQDYARENLAWAKDGTTWYIGQ